MNADLDETKAVVCQACGVSNAADAQNCASCGAPLSAGPIVPAPQMVEAPAPATPTQPERGGCLTAWLSLAMFAGVLAIPSAIGLFAATQLNASIVFTALEGVAYGIAALAMWKWKKWGVYLYFAVAVIGLTLRTISGPVNLGPVQMDLGLSAFGFVMSMLILYSVIKPKWKYFS